MQPYFYGGAQGALIKSSKAGWASGQTGADMMFVHGGPVSPHAVHSTGLTPATASEYLVGDDDQVISGGKMLFAFRVCAGNQLPANAEKPGGVGRLWGLNAHSYVFLAPAGTTYWSQGGQITHGAEVAFEYVIESADIVSYWAPSDGYVSQPGEPRSPRTKFQKVDWNAYLASRAHIFA